MEESAKIQHYQKSHPKAEILFPSSSCTTCCSFDFDLMWFMGENFGDEIVKKGICIIFGPDVKIKRSPLCGPNFEYFSEDPFLSTKMSGSFINRVQSKGVGCCMKHFATNNKECFGHFWWSSVDEKTFCEIYLASILRKTTNFWQKSWEMNGNSNFLMFFSVS